MNIAIRAMRTHAKAGRVVGPKPNLSGLIASPHNLPGYGAFKCDQRNMPI